MKAFFATRNDFGMLVLRVAAGAAMLPYGIQKVQGFDGTISFFASLGIPYIIALLVIAAETVGAVSLILGFCTRFCAACLSLIMVGAIIAVHGMGYFTGYVTPLLFLVMFITLLKNGAGAWSADMEIAKKVA